MKTQIAAVVCVALGVLSIGAEQEGPQERSEFLYTFDPGVPTPVDDVLGVILRQQIIIDREAIRQLHDRVSQAVGPRAVPLSHRVGLPLPESLQVASHADVLLDSASSGAGGRLLAFGKVVSGQGGQLVLTMSSTTLDGRLTVGSRHFLIRHLGDGRHVMLEMDPGALPPEAPPYLPMPVPKKQSGQAVEPHDHAAVACEPKVAKEIRVLVLYTKAARDGASAANQGATNPDHLIATAVETALAQANMALQYSGAETSFSTAIEARQLALDYVESGDGDRTLRELYDASHPLHQEASTLRRRSDIRANLVALVIEDWQYCGAAPVMIDWFMHPDQTAYSVVRRACLDADHHSLGHELAHSMGSAHDHANARVPGLFRYSYGFSQPAGNVSTIMAYRCKDCVRAARFSNPDLEFDATGSGQGYPSGCDVTSTDPDCPPAHNVNSIDRAACQVALWQ